MSAVISSCGQYRYRLERYTGIAISEMSSFGRRSPAAVFLMANPSTADAENDDATIRKCVGFAKRWDCGRLVVVNVMAGRSTDPAGLLAMDDPFGPENDAYLKAALADNQKIICAWGNAIVPKLRGNIKRALASVSGATLYCLGRCKDGSPRHPLMLAYSTPLEIYEP